MVTGNEAPVPAYERGTTWSSASALAPDGRVACPSHVSERANGYQVITKKAGPARGRLTIGRSTPPAYLHTRITGRSLPGGLQ